MVTSGDTAEKKTERILQGYESMFKVVGRDWQNSLFDLADYLTPATKISYTDIDRDIHLATQNVVRDKAGAALYIDADAMCLNPDFAANKAPDEAIRKDAAANPLDLSKPEVLKRVENATVINEYGDVSDGELCLAPVEGEKLMQAKTVLAEKVATENTDPALLKFHKDNLIPYGQVADLSFAMAKLMDGGRVPEFVTPSGTSLQLEIPAPFPKTPSLQASSPAFMN